MFLFVLPTVLGASLLHSRPCEPRFGFCLRRRPVWGLVSFSLGRASRAYFFACVADRLGASLLHSRPCEPRPGFVCVADRFGG